MVIRVSTSKTSELPKSESSISNEFNSFNNCIIIFHLNKMFPAQTMLTSRYKISVPFFFSSAVRI